MKEILKRKIERWDGGTAFVFLLWTALLFIIIFVFGMAKADREVRCYYLFSYGTETGIAYKLMADINYMQDIASFSSPDYKITMEVYKQLPQCGRD